METKEIILTNEIKAKLKAGGMLGFDVETPFKWVPKFYRDAKNNIPKSYWPVFTLRSRNGIELAEAEDGMVYINLDAPEGRKYVIDSGKDRLNTLRTGLISFKNYRLANDKVIEMVTGENPDQYIKLFHPTLQVEMKKAIDQHSELTAEELLGLG
jgi:hypothetical protein